MFQIHQQIFWEYPRNFRGLPTYGFAHAKVKKSFFYFKSLEFIPIIGIILNNFQSWFHSIIKIWVKLIWVENPKIPGIQPRYSLRSPKTIGKPLLMLVILNAYLVVQADNVIQSQFALCKGTSRVLFTYNMSQLRSYKKLLPLV